MGLEAAQAVGLINSAVLWQGQAVTLVGVSGTDAYIETSNASRVVSLEELELATSSARLTSNGQTFRTPGVFRHQPLEAATCSVESAEDDPSLNACFDPSNPENLDEILRQAGSSDPTQRAEGREALREAARQARAQGREREFNSQVREALEQIGEENPCDFEGAQQAYTEVQQSLPSSGANSSSNNGNSGNGNGSNPGAPVVHYGNGSSLAPQAGAPVVVDGSVSPLISTASLDGTLASLPSLAPVAGFLADASAFLTGTANASGSVDGSASNGLPVVGTSSLPAVFSPFTVPVPAFLPSSMAGALIAPRSPDAAREAGFFQAFFGSSSMERPSSDLMALLTHPSPSFAPKVYEVRRAVAEVIRTYNARYGAASPADRDVSLPIVFRYNPERRRIEVSIDVAGAGSDREATSFDSFRSPFRSLSGFRLGSSDHLRGDEFGFGPIVAYVPVPSQYLQGVRLGSDTIMARADGRATDRGITRADRRDSANDQHGGGGREDEREGRGSRGGRGQGEQREGDEENLYASLEEDLDSVAA